LGIIQTILYCVLSAAGPGVACPMWLVPYLIRNGGTDTIWIDEIGKSASKK